MRSSSLRTTGTLAVLVVGLVAPHPVSVGPAPAAASVGSPSGAALAPGWVDTSSREAVLAAWAVSEALAVMARQVGATDDDALAALRSSTACADGLLFVGPVDSGAL